jgi:hypothetical protein
MTIFVEISRGFAVPRAETFFAEHFRPASFSGDDCCVKANARAEAPADCWKHKIG